MDLVNKKIVRSRGVVFLEDQVIDDGKKGENSCSSAEIHVNLDLISPLAENTDQGGDVQEDGGDAVNDEALPVDDVELVDQVEQALTAPPVESQVRRSIRECLPPS